MRTLLSLLVVATIVTTPALGQVKTYEYHGMVENYPSGQLVKVATASADTLLLWTEHVTPTGTPPNRVAARQADVVVWCYAQKYAHGSHLFPDSRGKIYSLRRDGNITFYTAKVLERLGIDESDLTEAGR